MLATWQCLNGSLPTCFFLLITACCILLFKCQINISESVSLSLYILSSHPQSLLVSTTHTLFVPQLKLSEMVSISMYSDTMSRYRTFKVSRIDWIVQ